MLKLERQEITQELIVAVLDYHDGKLSDLKKKKDYYLGKHDILNRAVEDESKPNNKVVANYAKYIVDIMQGYFIGKPVSYVYEDKNFQETVQAILDYNDEQDENSELAKNAGIYGSCIEILYTDENADVRFKKTDPTETIVVYDTNITPEYFFAVRRYTVTDIISGDDQEKIEVYTDEGVYYYNYDGGSLQEVDVQVHYFDDVPIVEYVNNDEYLGDFDPVITLIDAYNQSLSEKLNNLEYFADAYLYLVGMSGTESNDVESLKRDRVILLEEKGTAGFLTKPSNDAEAENTLNRTNSDIHKFSMVMDLTDEQFANNASGVAMGYKLFALDQIIANKERKFKTGLMRRLELISNIIAAKGKQYDYTDVKINFKRNKPIDVKQAVEIAVLLQGIASKITAISELPMIEDPAEELKKIEEEKRKGDFVDLEETEADDIGGDEVVTEEI